ncbi:helix-turn-helix domain-containing protein [Alkalibacillus sp. S2W]|uniref:helix-turn-helix domain-containing protein n=1 Tax=Alkalibacillus sp. S2W TaxID=3386553 RepID=UPI00398CC772
MEQNQVKLTGEAVRIVRINLGMTQRELASKAGISPALVSMIENGEKTVTKKVEPKIREQFPISDEALTELVEAIQRIQKG